ncbi:hypothetical protein BofuT4_uP092000.1 [Botrytis cinerea T4]|uniref:Uncharacterized protein n=1 Tax=Botryotinia fuckeliana (strain T4) TaxID=999810 RepID=G2YEP3_BOTF4|nr:hypothetical protein BofuT4_uP092000.1 [Botrytis cinerea T4]
MLNQPSKGTAVITAILIYLSLKLRSLYYTFLVSGTTVASTGPRLGQIAEIIPGRNILC